MPWFSWWQMHYLILLVIIPFFLVALHLIFKMWFTVYVSNTPSANSDISKCWYDFYKYNLYDLT